VSNTVWLTQGAYDRLQRELEELKTSGRTRASAAIEAARAHGDLRENAEYDAAKEEQGKMEARIRQVEELLRDARIGEPKDTDRARPGLIVELEVDGDDETYLLGSREDRHDEFDVLSADSPMGRAVTDATAGTKVSFTTPAGVTVDVLVKAIRTP
jgi:transcription elongation factor GreA